MPYLLCTLLVLLIVQAMGIGRVVAQPLSSPVSEYLRRRVTKAVSEGRMTVEMVSLVVPTLMRFYQGRAYQPAWSRDSTLSLQVDSLVSALRAADQQGLIPGEYHLADIEKLLQAIRGNQEVLLPLAPEQLGDLDLLLTDAFLTYSSHLWFGRVNPAVANGAWGVKRPARDFVGLLQQALATQSVTAILQSLTPSLAAYRKLQEALAAYRMRARAGGWPVLPPGQTLHPGDQDERVPLLRARLDGAHQPLSLSFAHPEVFDEPLVQQVRYFQERHGLVVDGIVGPRTLAALNVPMGTRVRQLILNLERWRWFPRDLEQCAVIVNIAGFTLDVVEEGSEVLNMRIIVGKPYSRTPVFRSAINAVELNPAWHVPYSIATKELLPLIRRDPSYLTKHNMTVLQGSGANTQRVAPGAINWWALSRRYFPYRLRQEPGPQNALGRLKFHLPNPFSVYLHDTPTQALFAQSVRAFSHGCIRIEKPVELAAYALRDNSQWTRELLWEAIEHGVRETIPLHSPLPIYVGYWTAWVDGDGILQLREDLYGRDRKLDVAFP
ncbi:MAG: murein L,D-transpeptidase [Candidatus Binatia bacterium]